MFYEKDGFTPLNPQPPAQVDYLLYGNECPRPVEAVIRSLLGQWHDAGGKNATCTATSLLGESADKWNCHLNAIYQECIAHHGNGEESKLLAFRDAVQFMDWHIIKVLRSDNLFDFCCETTEGGYIYTCLDGPLPQGLDLG